MKVAIIGAGPAGLTAAYELLKQTSEYEVTVFEASEEVGGISKTIHCGGNRMDLGGHRFFSKSDRVVKWWNQFLPISSEVDKEDIMLIRKRVSRIYYHKHFYEYPVKLNWNTIYNLGVTTTISAGLSYGKSMLHKRTEESLEDFYINRFGRKLYSMFFEDYTKKVWGRHPREISPDWGAQRVKGLSIPEIIMDCLSKIRKNPRKVETSLIEEFLYPKYGSGQLWEKVASEVIHKGGVIKTGCCVRRIETKNHRITSIGMNDHGEDKEEAFDVVISSMPLKDLVAGMESVPRRIEKIAKGLPYRDFVTIGLLVDELNLVNTTKIQTRNQRIPDCWMYIQDEKIKMGRIQIYNNWSPYMVKHPDDTMWIGLEYFCCEGDKYWKMSDKDWARFAVNELRKMGILSKKNHVMKYHRERVRKAYPAYFDTYEQMPQLQGWLNSFENLYCIGRNGQHRYNNMDHSMMTAFQAVEAIQKGGEGKEMIWNVNVEKQYQEG